MKKIHTHYDNLKVSRNAPIEVIKAAYKTLAQKYHPDKNKDNPQATQIMILINQAFEVLSDPLKRKQHDQWIDEQEKFNNLYKKSNDENNHVRENRKYSPSLVLNYISKNFMLFFDFTRILIIIVIIGTISYKIIYTQNTPNTNYDAEFNGSNSVESRNDGYKEDIVSSSLPVTGYSNKANLNGVAPLEIKVSYGSNYWIQIVNIQTDKELASYFIRSGDILNIRLPVGNYKIKYAYGQTWFGEENLFGKNTNYAEADETMNFNFDGYSYNGYTIELIQQINGNLNTFGISKEQFFNSK